MIALLPGSLKQRTCRQGAVIAALLSVWFVLSPEVAQGQQNTVILSTDTQAALGGLTFTQADLIRFHIGGNRATLIFDGGTSFSNINEDVDAFFVLPNGNIVLSTADAATLGGLTFGRDDLVEFNSTANTATLFFEGGALFSSTFQNVDAAALLPHGNLLLSISASASLGGLAFGRDDLIEYNIGEGDRLHPYET